MTDPEATDTVVTAREGDVEVAEQASTPAPTVVETASAAPLIIDRSPSSSVVVARLESRVRAAEDALERSTQRIVELERRQVSELELVRARVDETMNVMSDTLQRQRAVQAETQERVSHLLQTSERTSRSYIDDLRGELTPRVMRVVQQVESFQARMSGEVETLQEETLLRVGNVEETLRSVEMAEDRAREITEDAVEELRNFTIRRLMESSQSLQEYREDSLARTAELSATAAGLQSAQRESTEVVTARLDAAMDRVESIDHGLRDELRRDLADSRKRIDDTSDELTERMTAIDEETSGRLGAFQTALDAQLDRFADQLELRLEKLDAGQREHREQSSSWIDERLATVETRAMHSVTEMVGRVDGLETTVMAAVDAERLARVETEQRLDRRAEELVAAAHEARQQASTNEVRLRADGEGIAQRVDDVQREITNLQDQVAEAVTTIASRLSNEVATVGGDVMAVQEVVRDLESRSAVIDQHRRRLDLLDEQLAETARVVRQVNQAVVGAVQRHRQSEPATVGATSPTPADDDSAS